MQSKIPLEKFLSLAKEGQQIVIYQYIGEDEGEVRIYNGPAQDVSTVWSPHEPFDMCPHKNSLHIYL